ncbi:MAG: DUF4911 domain-containing protein [Peptococcaceae bacterium]|jgi:hypothetical protein|nr:DUF4911 domain-containing protein [Peptococcaceae bacterium]
MLNGDHKSVNTWANCDLLVKAKVKRSDIQLLVKFVEGMGHLGVVTTVNRHQGEVLIQTTKYCWPDLIKLISELPIDFEILKD